MPFAPSSAGLPRLARWTAVLLGAGGFALISYAASAVPLPKPRPVSRNVTPQTTPAKPAQPPAPSAAKADPAAPAPKTLAARPAPPRKPAVPLAMSTSSSTSKADMETLEQIIELVRKRKPADATQLQASISDPVARKLSEWMILRSDDNNASSDRYKAFITENPTWPSVTFLRRRGEAALWDDKRDDAAVLAFLGGEQPISGKGRFMLARALLARGDRPGAERLVRAAWRGDSFSSDTEETAFDRFGTLLTSGDIKVRMDMLLYSGDNAESALRSAKRLGSGHVALAKARTALNKKASNAKALLDAVPNDLHNDPLYLFSKAQWLRREDKFLEAARAMQAAPRDPARLVNADEWWIERRLLARKLLDTNEPRIAYAVARDASLPARDIYKTEQEFTAGWIALRFLNDPNLAAQHFARIGVGSVNPTALARAGYWQGRAAEAAGRSQEARAAYESAAAQSTSYYGQLARAKLGLPQIALNGVPGRSRGGERLEVVRAVELLYALDEREIAIPILADMGERADMDGLLALCELTQRHDDARGMLMVGKAALNRGMPFDHYAYPVSGIPPYKDFGPAVEKAIVFAIARQESAFHPTIVSPANAYGLMQVTAGAGKYVAKKYGTTFDLNKLKTDPSYNAAFGAAELGGLIDDYRGSYIMTFAGYNAGRGSVRKWIERYGDPRDPKVDAVDWVEKIPFSETRNYVQRIMENVQVYRSRFGGGSKLLIEADLRRGAGVE
ncbi:lytic transglycosylase domain-containing protein [Afipia massiliensis]|uniref:Lytic transglycosylase domain-containing protein n=1 Tax=Afipia massiliensis TaxID=211460 RepID=A0A4V6BE89_9BRAD|nr:lytic transglycosylase domain-containing protein [Afipia massiliensis]TKT72853.1 lytic transglycosylase domain-containing protein [Afipia massiliensis]